jgi:hypothetical protein
VSDIVGGGEQIDIPRMPADEAEDTEAERKREAAFDGVFRWDGRVLHGFSSSRKNLLHQHRVAMGAPSIFQCMRDVMGFVPDAARILFLCWHAPDEPCAGKDSEGWETLRSDPKALEKAVEAWQDEHIHPMRDLEAVQVAMDIYSAAAVNRHEAAPVARGGGDRGN